MKKVRVVRRDLGLTELKLAPEEVARLTWPQRHVRLEALVAEAHHILDQAEVMATERRTLAATVLLFSGGNDSTVLGHLARHRCTHAAHANTGVGVEATRQFVRDTCASWGLPLLERQAPRPQDSYQTHVTAHGFPGSGMHHRMFQRLKERALEQVQRELVTPAGGGHRARVIYVAGRRRTESAKRGTIPELERKGSVVWASPMVNWTKLDHNTYRLARRNVPVNPVADLLHQSGECLCGCYAKQGEREALLAYCPADMAPIVELEEALADRDDIPAWARRWGWSWDQASVDASRVKSAKRPPVKSAKRPPVGYLCGNCEP